jgi:hypothetical protein
MRRAQQTKLIGGLLVFALMAVGSWYYSRDTLACGMFGEPDAGTKFNLYRNCMVNGVAGVATFFQVMPETLGYDTCWHRALDWVWAMNHAFDVDNETYYRWDEYQGGDANWVVVRQQSGIGRAFIEGFAADTCSTKYRTRSKAAANYLRLNWSSEPTPYEVIHETTHAVFGDMAYWHRKDSLAGVPRGPIRYSYDGGVTAIGIYFLKMYEYSKDGDTTAYYNMARKAAQYIKYVADTGWTVIGADSSFWAKWPIDNTEPPVYSSIHCEGAAGYAAFLDTMYLTARAKGDSDSATDLKYARGALQWLMDEAQFDTTDGGDTLYWWYRHPELAQTTDSSYSAVWGRGAAGISEAFLMGYKDLCGDSPALRPLYYHYAKGGARWVASKGEAHSGGLRWRYMFNDPEAIPFGDTVYYSSFCKGQGPIIRFFAEMYDAAQASQDYKGDTSFYYSFADTGRKYLEARKVKGYEGGYCWNGKEYVPPRSYSEYTLISVSLENGPQGLGTVMVDAAKLIGSEANPDSAYMALAYDCANWLKAEVHIDSIFPKEDDPVGGYKWPWRAVEDSITVSIMNCSRCWQGGQLIEPCTLLSPVNSDTFACSLYIHNAAGGNREDVFWWVDFLKGGNRFYFYDDSGTMEIALNADSVKYIVYPMNEWSEQEFPSQANPIAVNGSAAFWLDTLRDTLQRCYVLDQDCFRIYIIDEK